ncbi:MAG: ATP-dependent Lon protease [Candidatus Azotimanducaceae bacterium]
MILVGDPKTYFMLEQYEPRFADLFKVLADFGDTISRDSNGLKSYINVIARLTERDGLLPFSAAAVAALIEHGARICAQADRLTNRFGRIADIAREAAFIAKQAAKDSVDFDDIIASVKRSRGRADNPVIRFRRMVASGALKIQIKGSEVGQINGLAISSAGSLIYGFPSRITASIAFEQTYGGIDGDSASGTEFCCLISALTGLPINQNLAMTGAVDQKGNILAVGGATEKIEGFFDTCQSLKFTGEHAVLIPSANTSELMLRHDVVEAIANGKFAIHAIDTIDEAMSLMMSKEAGDICKPEYEKGTIFALAQVKAHEYWLSARDSHKS